MQHMQVQAVTKDYVASLAEMFNRMVNDPNVNPIAYRVSQAVLSVFDDDAAARRYIKEQEFREE